jgi:phage terminase Nu1 subunit (DNA packaging protein)
MKRETLNSIRALCLAPVAALYLVSATPAQASPSEPPCTGMHQMSKPSAAVDVKMAMRKLWEEHITYTRNYIISALGGLPDNDAIAQRLLSNQDDIGNAIKPYYGGAAGKQLSALLRDHILIATEVVGAAKAGDGAKLADAQKKWSANGKEIAAFLSGANPNWSKKTLEEMLQKHLDLTSGEVVGRLNKDWGADIKAYDDGHAHMLMFADMLTEGIAKQFPAKFK